MAGSTAQSTFEDTRPLVDRNFELIKLITHLWATNEKFQAVMPSEAHIVIIPLDDPELARFNLEISKKVKGAPLHTRQSAGRTRRGLGDRATGTR